MKKYKDYKLESQNPFSSLPISLFQIIEEHVSEEEIKHFYFKRLDFVDRMSECIIFTEKDIWFFVVQIPEIKVSVYKNYQVIELTLTKNTRQRYGGLHLKIHFKELGEVTLDSKGDAANEEWVEDLSDDIKDIFNYLKKR